MYILADMKINCRKSRLIETKTTFEQKINKKFLHFKSKYLYFINKSVKCITFLVTYNRYDNPYIQCRKSGL